MKSDRTYEALHTRLIVALAKAFPDEHSAQALLRLANYPDSRPIFHDIMSFWLEIVRRIDLGCIADCTTDQARVKPVDLALQHFFPSNPELNALRAELAGDASRLRDHYAISAAGHPDAPIHADRPVSDRYLLYIITSSGRHVEVKPNSNIDFFQLRPGDITNTGLRIDRITYLRTE